MTIKNRVTQDDIELICALLDEGMSSREVAFALGISKSTVNNYRHKGTSDPSRKPKILLFDTETAATIAAAFGRRDINLTQSHVIKHGDWLISAAWKFLGDKEVQGSVVSSKDAIVGNDFTVVKALYEAFMQADIVVAHNLNKFDMKMFKARLLMNGFTSMPKQVRAVDTLRIVKSQFRFASNKLDDLGDLMDIGRKKEHVGIKLWIDCGDGVESALQDMLEYNKEDVTLLENLYLVVRSFDEQAPNLAVYYNDDLARCRVCGSSHVHSTGNLVYTNLSAQEEIKCDNCGALSKTRKNVLTKEKRNSLLAR